MYITFYIFVMLFSEPHDQNPLMVSALNIVRGFTTPMDLVRVQTSSQVSCTCNEEFKSRFLNIYVSHLSTYNVL